MSTGKMFQVEGTMGAKTPEVAACLCSRNKEAVWQGCSDKRSRLPRESMADADF